eukprot:TRINITY_DN5577_c0_g1_i2.p1 TRINITY_DN5577_c0_g1~~TRINITY_DN5577_c0_g1_i2.p1  ORF type:complete len:253 (+),score=30.39 TRINITY_DN5577_c0_g1_i2:413-1171(+)
MSVGYDHIDVPECTKRGVRIGYTPGVLSETTADLVITLLLATARRIPESLQAVRSGSWPRTFVTEWMLGTDLHSSTVGIIGLGGIGAAVARRLKGFNCKILYSNPREKRDIAEPLGAEYVSFTRLLKESDFVIPLCPLNQDTKGLFNRETFKMMKSSSILVNCSRGPVVDQDALLWAVKNNVILGAGLDVTSPEPLPTDDPLLSEDVFGRIVVFPHIGSASINTRNRMSLLAAENLVAGLFGKEMPAELKPR